MKPQQPVLRNKLDIFFLTRDPPYHLNILIKKLFTEEGFEIPKPKDHKSAANAWFTSISCNNLRVELPILCFLLWSIQVCIIKTVKGNRWFQGQIFINIQPAMVWLPYTEFKARGGVRGHFCMFDSYESTFYCWTAAFYGTKISRRVKKLLTVEGQPLDSFPIEIYRGNLVKIWSFWSIFFCIWTLDAGKLV